MRLCDRYKVLFACIYILVVWRFHASLRYFFCLWLFEMDVLRFLDNKNNFVTIVCLSFAGVCFDVCTECLYLSAFCTCLQKPVQNICGIEYFGYNIAMFSDKIRIFAHGWQTVS